MTIEHATDLSPEEVDVNAIEEEISKELGFPAAISYVVKPDGTKHIIVHDRRQGAGAKDVDTGRVKAAASRAPKRKPEPPRKPPLAEK